jgi:hypothetical protein
VKVALGAFACSCVEERFGPNVVPGLRAALRNYARGLSSSTTPVVFPRFARNQVTDHGAVEFDLDVEPEVEAALQQEARAQSVQIDQLLTHAVFVFLAEAEERPAAPRYRGGASTSTN